MSMLERAPVSRLDTPWAPFAFAAVVYALFLFVRLAAHGWDTSYFVCASDKFCDPSRTPTGLYVARGTDGNDGQFYYRYSLDPFSNKVTDFGITLDLPAYRQQRILYPLVVWGLSLGHPERASLFMILVNYAALCLLAWAGGRYAQCMNLHALWGLAFACYPGMVLTLSRDLTEAVAAALVVCALLLVRQKRHLVAGIVLSLGVLARETTLLVAASACMVVAFDWVRGKRDWRGTAYLLPIAVYGAWQIVLWLRWGYVASVGSATMDWPFVAYARSLAEKAVSGKPYLLAALFEMLLIAALAAAAGFAWRKSRALPNEKIAWLLYFMLACVVSANVWTDDWSFLRNQWELYLFGTILVVTTPQYWVRMPLVVCWGGLWFFELVLRTDLHHRFWG